MTRRTLRMLLATLVLGAGLIAMPAVAKNFCSPLKNKTKGCKNEIKTCVTDTCTGLHGKEKRSCKKTCATTIKTACTSDNTVCTGSPSGAFAN